jgi:SagB-type dehydrogenase family enzyme
LESLRVVMMSGDWIPVKLPGRIRAMGQDMQVISLGGATEASIWSILYPIEQVPREWISIPYGKPMLNQTFHVLNSELAPCPDWVPGELFIGGIGLAKGYWRDPEKTAASFFVHPRTGERLYRTGDLGRYLPDGNIEFMGREDFQVKIQGFRVELGDIEAALEAHTGIRNAVVIAQGPDRGSKRLIAYIVAEHEPAPTPDEMRAWLSGKLPEYMVPGAFVQLEKLPLTANGKVDRRELPAPPVAETVQPEASEISSIANTDIARIVAELLGADKIDPAANLLQLGATSIEMIRIANALDQHLAFRPRMDEFYRDPSINGLTAIYQRVQPQAATAAPGGDPLRTPEWLLEGIKKIMDPTERNAFKASRPGLRRFAAATESVSLEPAATSEADYLRHRSYRDFSAAPVSAAAFGALLGNLRSIQVGDSPKYLYASAGGLYPVQTYLYIKPGRVDGIAGGMYYHDPEQHRLVRISAESPAVRELYDPLINRPIFDKAAFAIYLVVELAAIGAMYRERALQYATLEAGQITQLLEMRAPDLGTGLCQIGGLETSDLTALLDLQPTQLVLHGLLGGAIPKTGQEEIRNPSPSVKNDIDDRDEGEL